MGKSTMGKKRQPGFGAATYPKVFMCMWRCMRNKRHAGQKNTENPLTPGCYDCNHGNKDHIIKYQSDSSQDNEALVVRGWTVGTEQLDHKTFNVHEE